MNLRLFIMLLMLYGVHLFLYFSAVYFIKVTAPLRKRLLFYGFSLLSLSFMASAILMRLYPNGITGFFYLCGALWLGIAIHLLFAGVLCWLVLLISKASSRPVPMRKAAIVLTAGAILFSLYGVWNAFHPRVKEIDVTMPDLPDAWVGKKIVQISDVHLGAIYSPRYLSDVAGRINALKPDVIFITGDLFDGISAGGLDVFVEPLNMLAAKDGIFYVNGNHETYIGMERVSRTLAKTRMRVLRDEVIVLDGMQIIGVDYPEPGSYRDAAAIVRSRKEYTHGLPTILLYHTPTSIKIKTTDQGRQQTQTYWAPDMDFTAAGELGVDLQLSGHTHNGQMLPFVWLAGYLYEGLDYGLHKADNGLLIYVTSGLGSFGPPMRTATDSEIAVIRLRKAGQ